MTKSMAVAIEDTIARHRFDSLYGFASQAQNALGGSEDERLMHDLIGQFLEMARAYFETGKELAGQDGGQNGLANQRQRQLVDRLSAEWSTLMSFIGMPRFLPQDDAVVKALRRVIRRAWRDMNREAIRPNRLAILPHYDRHFELVTFNYAPEMAMIGIPFTSLYSPWDWSMIWHEMAGLYMQSRAAHNLIKKIDALLIEKGVWSRWLEKYPEETAHLPRETAVADAPQQPVSQVRLGWITEALEDGIGVLCLGTAMADALGRVLRQYYEAKSPSASQMPTLDVFDPNLPAAPAPPPGTAVAASGDLRHPPARLRVLIAQSLSYWMGLRVGDVDDAGASALAKAIYDNREQLVTRVFNRRDQEVLDDLVTQLNYGRTIDTTYPAYILIPALVQVINERSLDEETARSLVQNNLINHRFPNEEPVSVPDLLTTLLRTPQSWDTFFKQVLSFVDLGDAQAAGEEYSLWWSPGTMVLPITISNVWSHGSSHGPFQFNYHHSTH